jgi:non-ribosomal peptide synthetase component F
MATRIFDDLPPLLLNFEDPEDMIAKQEMVAVELQKRAQQAAASQAKQPEARTAVGPADGQRARERAHRRRRASHNQQRTLLEVRRRVCIVVVCIITGRNEVMQVARQR